MEQWVSRTVIAEIPEWENKVLQKWERENEFIVKVSPEVLIEI